MYYYLLQSSVDSRLY